MVEPVHLQLSVSGDDPVALFRALANDPMFAGATATELMIDGETVAPWPTWKLDAPTRPSNSAAVTFETRHWLYIKPGEVVKAVVPAVPDPDALMRLFERLPCTLASVRGFHAEWNTDPSLKLPLKGLGNGHHFYGSFVTFKGSGHARVVSRRWLEYGGPWQVHRGAGDLTLLQLHDLRADARTAYAQVRAVQDRLGPSDAGGLYIPSFKRTLTLQLQHSERDRKASIVVAKREVTPREMLEAASLRGSAAAGADRHIDAVAFIYIDEPQARRDLPELWLRELECWAYVGGRETRLDEDYRPAPFPRAW